MSQQKSPHEEFIMATIVGGLLFGICWAIWYFFHAELTSFLRWVRVGEMWLAAFFVKDDYAVLVPGLGLQSIKTWREWLPTANLNDIRYDEIRASTYVAVLPLRTFFAVALGCMALYVILLGPGTRYRRRMNLEGLIAEQARSFPTIAPFVKFNPRNLPYRVLGQPVPAKLPLFAEALSPEEWIAYKEIKVIKNQVDFSQTWYALAAQLGKRWQGPSRLSPAAQGIYAACALKHVRKRKEAEELLNKLALSWSPQKGLRLSLGLKMQIFKIIQNPKLGGALQKYADQHAFETTAMLRCLSRARQEGGVFAPAAFLWLRGVDRNLWYALNNLGRKSYHAEAVGSLVHFTNELIAAQKIPSPRFDDVIKGFDAFLKSSDAKPIPPLDKTMKKAEG